MKISLVSLAKVGAGILGVVALVIALPGFLLPVIAIGWWWRRRRKREV